MGINQCANRDCTILITGEQVRTVDGVPTAVVEINSSLGEDPKAIDLYDIVKSEQVTPINFNITLDEVGTNPNREVTVKAFLESWSQNPQNYPSALDYLVRSAKAFNQPTGISASLDAYLKKLGVTYVPPDQRPAQK